MNYQKIYNQIIERAKSLDRKKTRTGVYYESHHIIPKCLGGNNDKDNLVLLTAREHFICHRLLCEMYPDNKKIWYAMDGMLIVNRNRSYNISSRLFKEIKENLRNQKSEQLRVNNPMKSQILRKKQSDFMKEKNLMHRLTDVQKSQHRESVSKAKLGGLNPNAKKCVFVKSGEIFSSGAEMVRSLNLKITANHAVKIGLAKWL